MFVICNALDQTSLNLPPERRLRESMRHAGASILITSLTNALAFLSGAGSTIPAIASFCVYAAVTVMLLYISVLTIFLPWIFWDTRRVAKHRRECCGLCFCREDSVLFCRGRFLSEPQQAFSQIGKFKQQTQPKQPQPKPQSTGGKNARVTVATSSKEQLKQVVASQTEYFLEKYVAPEFISKTG